jgi:hypothetical protein
MEFYITLITALLFITSEALPFISKIKGNGLLHVLSNIGKKIIKNSENERLLPLIEDLNDIIVDGNDTENDNKNNNKNDNENENDNLNGNDNENNNLPREKLHKCISQEEVKLLLLENNKELVESIKLQLKDTIEDSRDTSIMDSKKILEETIKHFDRESILSIPKKYELIYIDNFIRFNYPIKNLNIKTLSQETLDTLKSLNYILNYDSENDIYNIKW